MITQMQKIFQATAVLLVICMLSACNFPGLIQAAPNPSSNEETEPPSQDYGSGECAFMWANKLLPDLSEQFNQALKAVESDAEGYAQAYGENCVTGTGEVVSFHVMETDFYITLKVESLDDHQILGEWIEKVIGVLADFPVDETPGPQPGYVGITFETSEDSLRLWVTQTEVESALESGKRGEELFNAIQAQ
jgi:hypothetical protein